MKGFFTSSTLHIHLKLLPGKGFQKFTFSGTEIEISLAQNSLYVPLKAKTISQIQVI